MAGKARLSREEILERYKAVRAKLGRAPGLDTLSKVGGVRPADVRYYWPRMATLATEAGETPNEPQARLPDSEVFSDYARICLHLGHIPTMWELRIATRELGTRTHGVDSRFGSVGAFDRRFRLWLATAPTEFDAILEMSGWDRRGPGWGRRQATPSAPPVFSFHPFLPAGIQYLDVLARGDLPPNEAPDLAVSTLFERKCADAFRALGFEVRPLGQGKGRLPDFAGVSRRDRYGVIVDAKARADGYVLGTDDRAFHEYVSTQTMRLRDDGLEKVYLAIVSTRFRQRDVKKLADYLAGSDVRGITFFTAHALMRVVEDSIRDRVGFTLADFEKTLFGNKLIEA